MLKEKNKKKYMFIYEDLRSDILKKNIEIGKSIPSENVLCKKYDVSRITIRNALLELQKNGYIKKHQGKGSIVINNEEKRKVVLLIVTNIFRYIFSDIIENIENYIRKENMSLFIACTYNNREIEQNILKNHLHDIDGVIFEPTQTSLEINDEYIKNIYSKLYDLPCILLNTKLPFMSLPSLTTDDFSGTMKLSEKLVEKGNKDFLTVFKIDERQGVDRLKGAQEIFKKYDNIKHTSITFDNYSEKFIIDKVYNSAKDNHYDVIMFYNDEVAYSFIQKYSEFAPNNCSTLITGFDSYDYSNGNPYYFPSLVHPKGKMGIDGAKGVIDLMNGQSVDSIVYDVIITNID